jgi:hypothetical protein
VTPLSPDAAADACSVATCSITGHLWFNRCSWRVLCSMLSMRSASMPLSRARNTLTSSGLLSKSSLWALTGGVWVGRCRSDGMRGGLRLRLVEALDATDGGVRFRIINIDGDVGDAGALLGHLVGEYRLPARFSAIAASTTAGMYGRW